MTAHSTRVLVGALVSAVALAGCGLGGGTSSTTTTTKKTTTLPTQQVTVPPLTSTATTVVPAVASTNQPGPSATSSTQSYTVQAGDAWFAIAQKLGVDLQALLDANGMTLTTALFPGMRLVVPPKSSPSMPPAQPSSSGTTTTTKTTVAVGGSYTVVANDSWGVIASKVGVKLVDLLSVNGATQSTVIHPGQVLKVPKGATATSTTTKAAATTTTTVKKA